MAAVTPSEVSASVTALARCSERVWLEASSETESVRPWIWTLGPWSP